MDVVPVIDLQGGQVVRGVAGERSAYEPVEGILGTDSDPTTIARAFRANFAFSSVYVADLDALENRKANWNAIERIAKCGLNLWLDVGISSPEDVRQFQATAVTADVSIQPIVPLESSPGPDLLAQTFATASDLDPIFSLDLRHGRPLSQVPAWQQQAPLEIARQALDIGFRRIIVLDLGRVGTYEGPAVEQICQQVRSLDSTMELISGGGVRDLEDLRRFHDVGCDAVLVASALHSGDLSQSCIRSALSWTRSQR